MSLFRNSSFQAENIEVQAEFNSSSPKERAYLNDDFVFSTNHPICWQYQHAAISTAPHINKQIPDAVPAPEMPLKALFSSEFFLCGYVILLARGWMYPQMPCFEEMYLKPI